MEITNLKEISVRKHPNLDEHWVQQLIAENPAILGLGDLVLKDRERIQPNAGRLDLLLQEPESNRRYEVEIQLGKTDESHIVRTIEYWDIERRRYPQYEHCGVIIAEDITSRFLNIIQLFNGFIPLVAIQMKAYEVEGKVALVFTKILDELKLGLDDEDEIDEVTDRSYWEAKGSKDTVKLADDVLKIIKEIEPEFEIKYNKHYIGLVKGARASNFTLFRAKKNNLRMEIRFTQNDEIEEKLENSDLDVMEYDRRSQRYRIRLTKNDVTENYDFLKELLQTSYESWIS